MLSYASYIWRCVLGAEVVYAACLAGGFLSMRTVRGTELHHALFETLPGVTWGDSASYLLGAIYVLIAALIFGWYYVWMHNASIVRSK